jgi:hypothetical protein
LPCREWALRRRRPGLFFMFPPLARSNLSRGSDEPGAVEADERSGGVLKVSGKQRRAGSGAPSAASIWRMRQFVSV